MKYLSMTAATLFLLAVPGMALAQSDNSGNATGNGAATTGTNGDASATPNAAGGDSQCNDQTASSGYDSFSEKCRSQIDAWAMGQSGASSKFDGDVAVGTVLPENVEIMEVPVYKNYGYVMLNDRRVLVDKTTHKVIRVY
jgi:hypothetical protein